MCNCVLSARSLARSASGTLRTLLTGACSFNCSIFRRWEPKLAINYGMLALVRCFVTLLFLSHWFACIWTLQTAGVATAPRSQPTSLHSPSLRALLPATCRPFPLRPAPRACSRASLPRHGLPNRPLAPVHPYLATVLSNLTPPHPTPPRRATPRPDPPIQPLEPLPVGSVHR